MKSFSVALGGAGLLSVGPLLATLFVGRTAAVPSVRWLGLTLALWITAGALGRAVARDGGALFAPLSPLCALAPLLPLAYLDDASFHVLHSAAQSVLTIAVLLLASGIVWSVTPLRHWLAGAPGGSSTEYAAPSPAALAPATGLALMIGTNDLLFEPLGQIGSQYVAHVLRGALVVAPAAATALALHVFPNRLQPVTTVVSASIAAFALAGLIGLGPGSALAPAAAVLALAAAGSATFWQSLSRPGRRALLALTVLGSAASLTLPARFGLGAREAVSIAPHLAERLPLVGALSLAVVLAVRGGLGWPNGHISRSAAIGGIRAA